MAYSLRERGVDLCVFGKVLQEKFSYQIWVLVFQFNDDNVVDIGIGVEVQGLMVLGMHHPKVFQMVIRKVYIAKTDAFAGQFDVNDLGFVLGEYQNESGQQGHGYGRENVFLDDKEPDYQNRDGQDCKIPAPGLFVMPELRRLPGNDKLFV